MLAPSSDIIPVELFQILKDDAVESAALNMQYAGSRQKTTRSFRYDLNKIPYNYTVKVGNIFKGLDLIDRMPEELWTEVRNIVQEVVIKTLPKKKKYKKAKWLSEKALQIAEK